MNVVILNTNSFGGNYEYSKCLAKAYVLHSAVEKCTVLIPENAAQKEDKVFKKCLISDQPFTNIAFIRKLYFLFRSIVNPFRVYSFLKKQPSSLVIFNDYEQISSFIWVPLFRRLKHIHTFSVILHDPDRDHYLPVTYLSEITMKRVMSLMDIAFYHEVLPDKSYYRNYIPKVKVPHGIYYHEAYDYLFLEELLKQKGDTKLIGILGNIRDEKNYMLVIESLVYIPDVILLIAGNPSNEGVPVDAYRKRIDALGLNDRVIWVQKKLTDNELQSAIKACDCILLYYKSSFTSQSGILNLIAPHKKELIISDTPSALRETIHTFGIGNIVSLVKEDFIFAMRNRVPDEYLEQKWNTYILYASWENHVDTVLHSVVKYKMNMSNG